ncbi:MAG: NAD(P)H-dependent oxidoreductase [Candidatus Absconditabacteria bacterium]
MKKVLIIMGNPRVDSYCDALANAYLKGVIQSGNHGELVKLIDIDFQYNLLLGTNDKNLEQSVLDFQKKIIDFDHYVFIYPTWRYNMPGILKAFLDRVFLSGFAYKFHSRFNVEGLLKGKNASVITTTDGPWFYYLFAGNPGLKALVTTLKFCGIQIKQVYSVFSVRHIGDDKRKRQIQMIENFGKNIK